MAGVGPSATSGTNRRPRVRAGRSINIQDWERQSKFLTKWNDELCSGETLPEVEIISLLEEQIPRYKLRADTLTKFGGYKNQDWFIPSPALQVSDIDLKLSPDQIREVLNYFLLCSERVSQMSKTYDDIEAVTRLLEEKEKDLELTARIGKELLQTNNKLEGSVEALESELRTANEKLTQLTHELGKKADLIQVLTSDMDEATLEAAQTGAGILQADMMQKKISTLEDENKVLRNEYSRLAQSTDDIEAHEQLLLKDITGQLSCANSSMILLEDELDRVREENRLQNEQIITLSARLHDTELKLHKFVTDNDEMSSLLQLTKDNQSTLALELADFKTKYYEVEALLRDAQEQLRRMRKKQMPVARTYNFPSLGGTSVPTSGVFDSLQSELEMSMHSELSADSGFVQMEHISSSAQYRKVFETVRCASQNSLNSEINAASPYPTLRHSPYASPAQTTTTTTQSTSLSPYPTLSTSSVGMGQTRVSARVTGSAAMEGGPAGDRRSMGSLYSNSSLGYPSLDSTGQSGGSDSDSDGYPGGQQRGIPGVPGAADLEAALKRLTPSEVLIRRTTLQYGSCYGGYEGSGDLYPDGCRTPDSLMSTGSGDSTSRQQNSFFPSQLSQPISYPGLYSQTFQTNNKSNYSNSCNQQQTNLLYGINAPSGNSGMYSMPPSSIYGGGRSNSQQGQQYWRLPAQLQIVKPLEGSATLRHWSALARPTLGGLLDDRPGVRIKGGKELEDMGLETYGLSDLEEDEEYSNPGKMFEISGPVYTLTNSTVMHPDDGTMLTMSNMGSRVTSVCSSLQNSPPETPMQRSRRNSCSTFSTNMGLAKMLNERGIKAVTPSCYTTPCGVNAFSPTATPYNSPDVTPPSSPKYPRSRSPDCYSNSGSDEDEIDPEHFSLPQMILSSMPEFVQQMTGAGAKKKVAVEGRTRDAATEGGRGRKGKRSLSTERGPQGLSSLLASPGGGLSIATGLYTRPALISPMAQLTCLLPPSSSSTGSKMEFKEVRTITGEATKMVRQQKNEEQKISVIKPVWDTRKMQLPVEVQHKSNLVGGLGVPGKPGSDAFQRRLEQLNARKQQRRKNGAAQTRPDLGTVNGRSKTIANVMNSAEEQQQQTNSSSSSLGTLSALLFGRKGGLF